MAVDLRRVVQNVGRLVRENVRKECARAWCQVLQGVGDGGPRMKCFEVRQRCASFLSHAGAWRSMCDCTL